MTKLRIITKGEVIHSWTVQELLPNRYYSCLCKCGNIQKIRAHDLLNNKSKTCRSCQISIAKKGHNQSTGVNRSSEYTSWSHMIARCTNPKNKDYPNYGERGITVCAEWLNSFEAFYMSMGPCPKGYTIDRKNTNGNYEPTNCCWSNNTEQSRNRRCNILITYKGQEKVLSQWIQELGITNGNTYYKQLSRLPENHTKDLNKLFEQFVQDKAKFE